MGGIRIRLAAPIWAALSRAAAVGCAALLAAACAPTSTPREGGWRDADLERKVEEILPRVAELANLPVVEPPTVRRADAATLEAYLKERLDAEYPGDTLANLALAYQTFGLLPDTVDLRRLLVDLLLEQAVGFYDPARDILFIRDELPAVLESSVLAHELVHALQDQRADLDGLLRGSPTNDAKAAAQAAIEGHATLTMFALQFAEMTDTHAIPFDALPELGPELAASLADPATQPLLAAAPAIVREPLVFAYLGGARFVQRLWRSEPSRPPPMDEWLPESTEQLLHTDRLLAERDRPAILTLAQPDSGWDVLYAQDLGELEIRIYLEQHTGDRALSERAASGWDGDVYALLSNGSDLALVWYTAWDSRADADEFAEAYRQAVTARFGLGTEVSDASPSRGSRVERLTLSGMPVVRIVEEPAERPLRQIPAASLEN